MKHTTPTPEELHPTVIAFRADPQLVAALDAAAEREGLKRSHIARRAVLREMNQPKENANG
jgi:predicted transcriptional regulator